MFISYIRLKNLISIHNAMRKSEIEIKFDPSNRITLILGLNGSGKTAVAETLHPFSGNFSTKRKKMILKKKLGEKEIHIIFKGTTYIINHFYKPKIIKQQDTHEVKSFIKKITSSGEEIELNESGNVTSFIEVVSEELHINPLYMKLMKLGSGSSNIVTMNISDRKKYISNLELNLEVIQSANKDLVSKYKTSRSLLARVTSKIDEIGDLTDIELNLNRVESALRDNKNYHTEINNRRAVVLNNIDGQNLQNLEREVTSMNNKLRSHNEEYKGILEIIQTKTNNDDISKDDINNKLYELTTNINNIDDKLKFFNSELSTIMGRIEERYELLEEKKVRIAKLKSGHDINFMMQARDTYMKKYSLYQEALKDISIDNYNNMSKNKLLTAENNFVEISDMSNILFADYNVKELKEAVDIMTTHRDYNNTINSWINEAYNTMTIADNNYNNYSKELIKIDQELNKSNILESRPKGCKIDSCIFIKEALSINIDKLKNQKESIDNSIIEGENIKKDCKNNIEHFNSILTCCNKINNLLRFISSKYINISTAPVNKLLLNENELFKCISRGNIPIETNLSEYIEILEAYDESKELKIKIDRLNSDIANYESKLEMLTDIETDKNRLEIELTDYQSKVTEYNSKISDMTRKRTSYNMSISMYKELFRVVSRKDILEDDIHKYSKELPRLIEAREKLKMDISEYNLLDSQLKAINSEIKTLSTSRDEYIHKSKSLEQYLEEKKVLEKDFFLISLLKDISSSTKGIPLVFIDLYLSKCRSIANRLLKEVLGDEYTLQKFIINEKEFSIPCIREGGEVNEDVSTMSDGEKAIMTLIISVALASLGNIEYNIFVLDEMDRALDYKNKEKFIGVLEKIMDLFDNKQTILISHNDSFESYPVNVIKLRGAKINNISNKKILFDFDNM